jgi:hypothetical protein
VTGEASDAGRPDDTERSDDTERVRHRLRTDHAETLDRVWRAADAVAAEWESPPTDRAAVVDPLGRRLTDDTRSALLGLLSTAVETLGESLPADPVPAPPYLVVTSAGPVVRATLSERRLVVELRAFVVDRDGDRPTYRRGDDELRVRLR